MDISDGACTDIDASRSAAPGDPNLQVAVCLQSNPNNVEVAAFQFRILHDDTIIQAPEVANAGTALDDNPDANAGATTFSTPNLGTAANWDCSGGVGAFPVGDLDATPGDGDGTVFSGGCANQSGVGVTLFTGPLGVVTFDIVGGGTTALTLANVSVTDNNLVEVGSCNPPVDAPATCNNGSITVSGATNTPLPATSTPTPPGPTNTPCVGTACNPTPITNDSSSTPTPSATGEATTVPGETPGAPPPPPPGGGAPPPPGTGTGQPGAGVTGPDTGDGTGSGSGSSMNLMLIAASGALFVAAGAGVAWRRRRAEQDVR
jgi:hypothetical protein